MQTKPTSWNSIFASPHITEYRFDVNGVSYYRADLKEAPVIKKPLLDKPAIGRCCTGSVQLKIFPKGDIPKAAAVNAYCRLKDRETGETTDWLQQGKFLITRRQGKRVLTLQCSDYMIKAGQTYRDKTAFTEWPQPMSAVVNEICQIMGVTLDARTVIKSGTSYTVNYPNDDTLMSEVLRNIAAAHGGNWIMTEAGKLRLVPFASPVDTASQILGKAHGGFEVAGRARTVSRVILTDSADNQFTAGDDSDMTITASCEYATAAIADALCAPSTASLLYGVTYQAYTLATAYLDPALELGDTISVTARDGTEYKIVIFSLDMSCTTSATCALTASIDDETEDEYPYISVRDLSLSRAVKTNQTYYGNRINRTEGFVSELLVNGTAQARLTANASVFSMQAANNGAWSDRIYFDAIKGKYVITGDVEVQGLATFQDSLENGTTTINGGCITTGTIDASDVSIINLDASNITAGALSANYISGGVLNCSLITVTNLSANSITSGTMSANRISGGTIDASQITVSNLSASNITGGTLDFDKVTAANLDVGSLIAEGISASYIIGGTLDCSQITVSGLSANDISTGTLSANYISGGTLDFDNITVSNLSASDISTGSLSASRISGGTLNFNNITVSNLSASDISTGSLSASRISGGTLNFNDISVSNLSASDITTGSLSASRISGGTLDCSKMTVSNLDASSLTAGTIKASLIDVDNLKVKNLYYDNNNTMVSGTGNTVYLGGNGSWGVNYANVYASSEVGIGSSNSWGSRVVFDVGRATIQPKSARGWSLGTSSYPFEDFYCNKVSLGISSYNSQVGFFGTTPVAQQTVANNATVATLITALKKYGLIK